MNKQTLAGVVTGLGCLLLVGVALPAQAQDRSVMLPKATTGAGPTHLDPGSQSPQSNRMSLQQRLLLIIKELKKQGPPAAGCMEG